MNNYINTYINITDNDRTIMNNYTNIQYCDNDCKFQIEFVGWIIIIGFIFLILYSIRTATRSKYNDKIFLNNLTIISIK